MTPGQIESWLAQHLHRFDQPAQMLGDEPNSFRKDWDSAAVRWLIAASWPYFHQAGNQSIPAVYHAINRLQGFLADLSYLPETPRDMGILERGGVPVFGVESKHQLRDFDVVGTSIAYTVLFMNFCKTLQISGVPLRWRDREAQGLEQFPFILIGGQGYCAPGAMEPVADAIWCGEVEDEEGNGGIGQVCSRIAQFKRDGLWQSDRLECYRKLAREFNYLFFPRFVEVEYAAYDRGLEHPSKQVAGYRSLLDEMAMPFRARHVIDLDKAEPLLSAPLLYSDPSYGAGDLEVGRGCDCWCAFCRLSWVTKPYRQRSVAGSVAHAKRWQLNMGSVELSPFAPDFPVHTEKRELLSRLLSEVTDEIDSATLRVDDFIDDEQYVLIQAQGGSTSITVGVEGASQRMRDLVGKGASDEDVVKAVTLGIRMGFRKFKIYMINNLPGEEEGDVLRAVRLAQRLAAVRDELGQPNVLIQFSFTPLLIEAQTPFQWFAPTPPNHRYIQVADVFRQIKVGFKIGVKAEPNKQALFQLVQRASREVGEAIVDVLEQLSTGCWGGVPRDTKERLEAALKAHGFANGFADCFDERGQGDLFGWEYISTGVSQELMWRTYRQMVEFLQATDPETYDAQVADSRLHGNEWVGRCKSNCEGSTCGACKPQDFRKRKEYAGAVDRDVVAAPVRPVDLTSVATRLLVRADRPERYRYATNDFYRFAIRRAAYRAAAALQDRLPEGTSIAKRSIRFTSDPVSHKDWVAGADYVQFGLTRELDRYDRGEFLIKMATELSPWLKFGPLHEEQGAAAPLGETWGYYELEVDTDPAELARRLAEWERAEFVKLMLATDAAYFGLASAEVNAKELVKGLWPRQEGHRLKLRLLLSGAAGPYQVAAALLGRPSWLDLAARTARRLDWFRPTRDDLLVSSCIVCGSPVPEPLLGLAASCCLQCDGSRAGQLAGR